MKTVRTWALVLFLAAAGGAAGRAAAPPPLDLRRVGDLVRQLDDDRFRARERADRALRRCGPSAVPFLRDEQERTKSLEVRARLAKILKLLTAGERVPELVRQLGDSRSDNRELADYELRRYGGAVVPLLKKQLREPLDPDRRRLLEQIIADLAPPRR
jgi:HEAT repeat protein